MDDVGAAILEAAGEDALAMQRAYRLACTKLWRAALAVEPGLADVLKLTGWNEAAAVEWLGANLHADPAAGGWTAQVAAWRDHFRRIEQDSLHF